MTERVFPASMGWWLVNPLRKLLQNPDKILGPYIREGMVVLEPGCAMGFFSLPAARMVGAGGKVICVDVQAEMIAGLKKRALKAGLADRIETRVCDAVSLRIDDVQGAVDFAFAIAVVHEVPDHEMFFKQIAAALKPVGQLLFAEPKGHVPASDFARSLRLAAKAGLKVLEEGMAHGGRIALLRQ